MSKKLLIMQSNYIPWKGYFDLIASCDDFFVYDDMQYTKGDWRNRNRIKTPRGVEWLSIPVTIRGKLGQSIRDTRVANRDWPAVHWRKIQDCYSQSPFLAENTDFFADLYEQAAKLDFISDVNLLFLTAICGYLKIDTNFRVNEKVDLVEDRTQRLVDICHAVGADQYCSGPAARAYMSQDLFEAGGIDIHWFDYAGYPEYTQPHPPFDHQVSIIDLILSVGPEAKNHLKSSEPSS